ncbi:MAG TPA: PQQ-binding-like beta-propeller repeat protein, partial [Lautropia sp.]|nr:PQQ-binding-like beta-propeller repeat protein [Lautropia sp.]
MLQKFSCRAGALIFSAAAVLTTGMISAGDAKAESTKGGDADVLTYGMGLAQQRYSPLSQINRENVKNLVPVWNLSLDNSANMSTQPLVQDGVMYVVTHNSTAAIDAVTGQQKWKTMIDLPDDVGNMICCGIHARGLALRDGVIYRPTLDAHMMAMSAADGTVLWRTKVEDYKIGYS